MKLIFEVVWTHTYLHCNNAQVQQAGVNQLKAADYIIFYNFKKDNNTSIIGICLCSWKACKWVYVSPTTVMHINVYNISLE